MKEDKLDKVVKAVVKAIDERMNKKPKSYYTEAEVLRVDKGSKTAYVHIPGGVDQTPASLTIDAKKGDTVQVRVGEGKAFIVGNVTNPPSDNEVAEQAKQEASSALSHSLEAVVDDTMFYLASDQDTGVTVEDEGWTEEPQEPTALLPYLWVYHRYTKGSGSTFYSDPMIIAVYTEDGVGITAIQPQYYLSTSSSSAVGGSWSNSLTYLSGYYIWTRDMITYSDGTTGYSTAIYDQALTEACSLSYNSAQYFWTKTSSNYMSCPTGSYVTEVSRDYYDPDKGGTVSGGSLLLRSAGIYIRNAATTVAQFLAAGVTLFNSSGYTLAEFLSSGLTIYNGSGTTVAHLGYGSTSDAGTSTTSPYFTLGNRKSGSTIGTRSLTVGSNMVASGTGSLAIGKECIADNTGKLAIGKYNSNTSTNAFEIGNGSSSSSRSTTFAVTYTGDINASGMLTAGAINSSLFVTERHDIPVPAISAGDSSGNTTDSITKSGTATERVKYIPIAIMGFRTGSVHRQFVRLNITSTSPGGGVITFNQIADSAVSAQTADIDVLWLKTTA